MMSPPLFVKQRRALLDILQHGIRHAADRRHAGKQYIDIMNAQSHSSGGVKQTEYKEQGEHSVFLFLQHLFPRKRQSRHDEARKPRDERRRDACPYEPLATELTAQKLLFGKHDTLVINPENKNEHNRKPHAAGQHGYAEIHVGSCRDKEDGALMNKYRWC